MLCVTFETNSNMIPVFDPAALSAVKELITNAQQITITTHHKPDGDALGASLALCNYLKAAGKNVKVVVPSEYPDFLAWMKGSKEVIDFVRLPHAAIDQLNKSDLIFCLDFNDPRRVEKMQTALMQTTAQKILIDHHLHPVEFCNYTFSFTQACATAEILYYFILALDGEDKIDRDVAECLYAGIMTDSGNFRFASVTPETFKAAAALIAKGARHFKINEWVYDSFSLMRLKFLGMCLKDKLTVVSEFNTAYFAITKAEQEAYQHKTGDMEDVVNYALSIKGIRMAALFSEGEGIIKISFRSKDLFSVKELSEKYFEGGGHLNAAGGKSKLSLSDTVIKFREVLTHYKEELTA